MNNPKVILHVGSHKTGTTGIQFALSENRPYLRSAGVWYPRVEEFFPVDPKLPSSRAHFAFGNAVARFTQRDRKLLAHFVSALNKRGRKFDRTILSAESLYRLTVMSPLATVENADEDDEPQTGDRALFLDRLAAVMLGFDTEVLMYLRRVDRFAASFYAETISSSFLTLSFQEFLETNAARFEYRQQIDGFSTYFPLKVRNFEAAARAGLMRSFCADAGIPGELPDTPERRRPSVSNTGVLWLIRARQEREIEKIERRRRWHFALQPENAGLFENDRKTGFWRDRGERDAFVDRYQSDVPEVAFPGLEDDIAPLATWSDAQHADAERRFLAWQAANEDRLKARERHKIPPHVLEDPPEEEDAPAPDDAAGGAERPA